MFVAAASQAAAAEPLRLKALTFNIRLSPVDDGENGWSHRRTLVAAILRDAASDFAGLQEAWSDQIDYLRQQLPEYGWIVRSREADPRRGEATPLLYRRARWRLDDAEQGTFWLSATPEVPGSRGLIDCHPRIATWGRFVDVRSGRGLYVYNTHLCHLSELARLAEAVVLAQRVASRRRAEPFVLVGDFNAEEGSAVARYLLGGNPASPLAAVDCFRAAQPTAREVGTFHAFLGTRSGPKIDHIFAPAPVRVLSAQIVHRGEGARYPSDHFPVVAEIEFP